MNTSNTGNRRRFVVLLAATALLALSLTACASAPPSSSTVAMPGQTDAQLFALVTRALVAGGYEIKSKDESARAIQAFRPMRGAFSKPGYGHNVTILIGDHNVTVTAFQMEGAIGAESPEQVRDEVMKVIQNAK
jgi:hypothetical protein